MAKGALAIIPARGGSKRIPRKNEREFAGKPILAWVIEAARGSECFEHIVVSTEDESIANLAVSWGAEVPFSRPISLADDFTGTVPVVRHALEACERLFERRFEQVACLYATAPFIEPDDLKQSLDRLDAGIADYVFPVTEYEFPVQRSVTLGEDERVKMQYPEYQNTRSQDLKTVYHDAGQFYWGKRAAWLGEKPIMGGDSIGWPVPRYRVLDIDTPDDWIRAEAMFKVLRNER